MSRERERERYRETGREFTSSLVNGYVDSDTTCLWEERGSCGPSVAPSPVTAATEILLVSMVGIGSLRAYVVGGEIR